MSENKETEKSEDFRSGYVAVIAVRTSARAR